MSDELLAAMTEAPGRELVVTIRGRAYVRDPLRNFVSGPWEANEYQSLIDDGVLIESPDFCSVFVFNPLPQPPDFSSENLEDRARWFTKTED